jgi:2-oxoglutarate ferredoxin oxidoreductase subunit delta
MVSKVYVNIDWCKGCVYCVKTCPKKALAIGEDVNQFGYRFVVANQDLCIGCGLCYIVCPDYALSITSEEKEGR